MTKSLFASKTFWFNAIATIVMIGEALADTMPPEWTPIIGAVVGIGNVLLRLNTSQAVALIPPKR